MQSSAAEVVRKYLIDSGVADGVAVGTPLAGFRSPSVRSLSGMPNSR